MNGFSGDVHYIDTFELEINNSENLSVDYLATLVFTSNAPGWEEFLFKLRNFIVKPFGLETEIAPSTKTLDKFVRYEPGDFMEFFPVVDRTESEILMAKDEKHLYFRVSVMLTDLNNSNEQTISVTTVVRFNNVWGHVYFMPVKPFHKIIVGNCLKRLVKQLDDDSLKIPH